MSKKHLYLALALFFSLAFFTPDQAQSQIVSAWTSTIKERSLPVGATVPTVTELSNPTKRTVVVTLTPAATYDNATETTAWTAIGNATKVELDSNYVVDVFRIDTTLDTHVRYVITDVDRGWDNFTTGNKRDQYTAATDVFFVTVRCEWEADAP